MSSKPKFSLVRQTEVLVTSVLYYIPALKYLRGGVVNLCGGCGLPSFLPSFPSLLLCWSSICGCPVQCDRVKLRRGWICLCAPGEGP